MDSFYNILQDWSGRGLSPLVESFSSIATLENRGSGLGLSPVWSGLGPPVAIPALKQLFASSSASAWPRIARRSDLHHLHKI